METKQPAPPSPGGINYLYFGVYFLFVILLSVSSVFAKNDLSGSRIFFLLYATGQVALETSLLVFAAFYIRKFLGTVAFGLYIGATFLLLLVHLFDFLMDRILDLSVWETIRCFLIDDDWNNFIYLLDASGVPLWIWGLALLASLFVPLIGVFLYRLAESLIHRKPLPFRPDRFLMTFFCLPAALLFWDFSASRVIHPDAYTQFLQSLPWKFTFLEPRTVIFPLEKPIHQIPQEQELALFIEKEPTQLTTKPNIYLFVTESLRRDFVTETVAPNLSQFAKETTPFEFSLSNANGTMLSWFSIFHSQYAFHWEDVKKKNWSMGSPPLALLKKWGYKIHVYTSAELGYYGSGKILFGDDFKLLDSFQNFHQTPPMKAADGDRQALLQLQQDLANNPSLKEGQVFIIFWDASHFDYNWPKDFEPKFVPFAGEFAFLKAFHSEERIELIKNRYRNAVSYIDDLFGKFLKNLPEKEEAIVVFTGDHGEEFFEHGHLSHNSHLTEEQTVVPLFMKFGSKKLKKGPQVISQIDIFPSILNYLSKKEFPLFEGQSIFHEEKRPFAIVSRFNANRAPYEFFIHNGKYKFIARFPNRHNVLESKELHIRSLKTVKDETIPETAKNIKSWIDEEFLPAINHLTSKI